MKKWPGILFIAAIAAAAFFYSYQISHEVKVASLESIVPEDALYYIYSYNPDEKIKDFTSSPFFQQASESSLYRKFIKPKVEKLNQKLPFLADMIKKDTAFAVFSLGDINMPQAKNAAGSFLLLARVDNKKQAHIKKAIADFYLLFAAKEKSAYKQHKGVRITSYTLPSLGMTIYYALLSDVLVLGNNIGLIQKSIDMAKSRNHSGCLRNNTDFQRVSAKVKKDVLLWGYGNTKGYYQEMVRAYAYNSLRSKEQQGGNPLASFVNMKPIINLINTLGGYSFYLDYDALRAGLVFKSYTLFNRTGGEDSLLALMMHAKPIDENAFAVVPKTVVAYYGASQDFMNAWLFLKKFYSSLEEMVKAEMKSDPRYYGRRESLENINFGDALKMVESFLGVDIEQEVLSLLGNNFGVALVGFEDVAVRSSLTAMASVQQQEAAFIFPQFYIFCELKDSLKMQKVMEGIMRHLIDNTNQLFRQAEKPSPQYGPQHKEAPAQTNAQEEQRQYLQLREKECQGVTIRSIDISDFPIDSLKLNYCILDKYIVLSLSPGLTEKVIGVYKNHLGSFNSNYSFESAQGNVAGSYSHVMFLDFEKMLGNVKATQSFRKLSDSVQANAANSFSGEDLDSLMAVLGNIKAATFTSRLSDPETLESSGYMEIEGL